MSLNDIKKLIQLKFLFVVRKEEDFSILSTFHVSAMRIAVLFSFFFLLVFGLAILSTKTVLKSWFDPAYIQLTNNSRILQLTDQVDSLLQEVTRKDQFIENFQLIIKGDAGKVHEEVRENKLKAGEDRTQQLISQELSNGTKRILEEFQQTQPSEPFRSSNTSGVSAVLGSTVLFRPIKGVISAPFNPVIHHFGVDVLTKDDSPVQAIADGTVIISNWTLNTGYVIGIQHRGELISLYKHNSVLLKEVGEIVRSGEIIAIVGNSGEMTTGAHLHFELWYKGSALNPQQFINFD
jgi:murein DD-endopeptidase MepM/ murein hydrolase activator NlpD